jgi:hypothetical protein
MYSFKEPIHSGAEPEPEVSVEEFTETCLDFYDVVLHGARKERKRAAEDLVILAVAAYNDLKETEFQLGAMQARCITPEEEPATLHERAWASVEDVPAAPSNLHTHGDDEHL